jgi:hypothetical protein
MNNTNSKTLSLVLMVGVIMLLVGVYLPINDESSMHMEMSMDNMGEHRGELLAHRDSMIEEMLEHGNYRCCLEKPCAYCIEKTPGHGEGATCDCLADIVAGEHPCGECIGEILEGHGNPYLSEYFALAIAEEVGEKHIDTLREIISDKYDISTEDQR